MHQTGERWRLGHRPALDGLRGIAILLVLIGHVARVPYTDAFAPSGVVVFFALSGFLITTLLLEELANSQRISLRAFYWRRARRLLPALFVCVTGVAIVVASVPGFVDWPMVLGALTYSANWIRADGVGFRSALSHTWSLSIEEQFYLLWPLVLIFAVRLGRRGLACLLGVAIATSTTLAFVLVSTSSIRVYFGSDTRAAPLLMGCLLAVCMHGRRREPRIWPGLSAVTAVLLIVFVVEARSLWAILTYGQTVVAALTLVLILCSCSERRVGWLEWQPLRAVGVVSYGLYLWHWPVSLLVSGRVGSPVLEAVVVLTVTGVVTWLSWRYVERPILRRRRPCAVAQRPLAGSPVLARR